MAVINRGFLALCRSRGVDVVEMLDWENRGESGRFSVRGIIQHHDAMGLHNDNVPRYMMQNGVDGAQLWVKYTGQLYVLAAGLKWHAGSGWGWRNIPANGGNAYCVGIECDYSGIGPRPKAIDDTLYVVAGCLVDYYKMDPQRDLALHKEYAPDRKIDLSNFDADLWRQKAGQSLSLTGTTPIPPKKEWDEMATPDEIRTIVREEVAAGVKKIREDSGEGTSLQGVYRMMQHQDDLTSRLILDVGALPKD